MFRSIGHTFELMVVETTAQPMIASIRRSAAFRPEDAVGP
jgi:hypothetical protein